MDYHGDSSELMFGLQICGEEFPVDNSSYDLPIMGLLGRKS